MSKLGEWVLSIDTDLTLFSVENTDQYIPPFGEYFDN